MHADDVVEVLVSHLPQHRVTQDAGVGDEDVEAAELRDRSVHQRLRDVGGADGANMCDSPAAGVGDGSRRRVGDLGVDVVDDDSGTGRRERPRVGEPEPPAAARDDRDPAVEGAVCPPSWRHPWTPLAGAACRAASRADRPIKQVS